MDSGVIYGIYISGRIIYIGRTTAFKSRCIAHLSSSCNKISYKASPLYNVLNQCILAGIVPSFRIIEVVSSDRWEIAEREHIEANKDRLVGNVNIGGQRIRTNYSCKVSPVCFSLEKCVKKIVAHHIDKYLLRGRAEDVITNQYYIKKSRTLDATEIQTLKKYTSVQGGTGFILDNAGISHSTLSNMINCGNVQPRTISKIRKFLTAQKVA